MCVFFVYMLSMSDSLLPYGLAHQAPLAMEFSRPEYWTWLPFPTPGDLFDPGIKPPSLASPVLEGRFFTTSTTWEAPSQHVVAISSEVSIAHYYFFLCSFLGYFLNSQSNTLKMHKS